MKGKRSIPLDCPVAVSTMEAGMVVELADGECYGVVVPIVQLLVRHVETGAFKYIGAGDGAHLVETWNERPGVDRLDICVRGGEGEGGR